MVRAVGPVVRREVVTGAEVDHRRRQGLRQRDERAVAGLRPTDEVGQDDRALGGDHHVGQPLQVRQRRGDRVRQGRDEVLELGVRSRLFLEEGVDGDERRAFRRRHGQTVRPHQAARQRVEADGLVVPLHEVPHDQAVAAGGVDPVDPGPAPGRVSRSRSAEHHHRHLVHPGVEDAHGAVLEPDQVVQQHRHRFARRLGVAVGQRDRHPLERRQHHLRAVPASEGVVQAAQRGAGVQRGVADAQPAEQLHCHVTAVSRHRAPRSPFVAQYAVNHDPTTVARGDLPCRSAPSACSRSHWSSCPPPAPRRPWATDS